MPDSYAYVIRAPNEYFFTSDFGSAYTIVFSPYRELKLSENFQDSIFNVTLVSSAEKRPPKDYTVSRTVRDIFFDFFSKRNVCLIYMPDFSDGKHKIRNELFKRWVKHYDLHDKFELISIELEYEAHSLSIYTNIIYLKDYPFQNEVLAAFQRKIEEYEGIK
ncbi:MAG: DUF6169 family protein [Bacteroidia bacterium]